LAAVVRQYGDPYEEAGICWQTRRFMILAAYLLTSGSFRFHSSILTSFARAQLGNSLDHRR
jgi:hypothetical protein